MEKVSELLQLVTDNRYLAASALVVGALLAAYVVDFVVSRVCRSLAGRTSTSLDDSIIELIHRPVRVTVILVGLWLAANRLELPPRYATVTGAVLASVAILLWTGFAIRLVTLVLRHVSNADGYKLVEPRTRPLFDNLTKMVIVALAIYLILISWNVNVSAWLASAGIIGIAVGFAAKDTLANLFSGIFILADAPYKVGDYINLDSGERGEVTHIGLRSTRLLTRDDVEVTIPNAVIANAKIVNETGGPSARERIRVDVGVAYGSSVDRLREVLNQIAAAHPEVCQEPEPRVRFRTFGDHSINFQLLCWIQEPVLRGRVVDALNTEIYKCLAREGIEIPYPKRDVYVKQLPGEHTGA